MENPEAITTGNCPLSPVVWAIFKPLDSNGHSDHPADMQSRLLHFQMYDHGRQCHTAVCCSFRAASHFWVAFWCMRRDAETDAAAVIRVCGSQAWSFNNVSLFFFFTGYCWHYDTAPGTTKSSNGSSSFWACISSYYTYLDLPATWKSSILFFLSRFPIPTFDF